VKAQLASMLLGQALGILTRVKDEYPGLTPAQLGSLDYALTILVKDVIPRVIAESKGPVDA
jgi:hypothetical protein